MKINKYKLFLIIDDREEPLEITFEDKELFLKEVSGVIKRAEERIEEFNKTGVWQKRLC